MIYVKNIFVKLKHFQNEACYTLQIVKLSERNENLTLR